MIIVVVLGAPVPIAHIVRGTVLHDGSCTAITLRPSGA